MQRLIRTNTLGRTSHLHTGCLLSGSRPRVVRRSRILRAVEPFKTVLSGDREAIARLTMKELEKILERLSGMTADEFQADVKMWL